MRIFVLLFTVRSIYILTLIKMAKPNAVQFLSAHLKTLRLFEKTCEKQKALIRLFVFQNAANSRLIPVVRKLGNILNLGLFSAAPEQPLTHGAHVMHEAEQESMATECDDILLSIFSMKHQLTFLIPCHRRYSQSECRKAVVYSMLVNFQLRIVIFQLSDWFPKPMI